MPFAPEPFAKALTALVTWYETGLDSDRQAFDIAWVQNRDSDVDTMNGFIEVYMDARGMKGAWEGVVYYANHEKTDEDPGAGRRTRSGSRITCRSIRSIASRKSQGVSAQAIEVVVEAGDSGPITPIGVNLPNDQRIREKYGSKSVSLSNVLDAYEQSMPDSFRQEFAWDDAEVERAKRWGAFASELTTEIHEVLGHGSGRMADHIAVHAAGSPEGAVFGARRDARRSGGAVFRRRSVSGARSAWCRPTSSRPSSRPSTRRTRATRWCSCAGCASARSSKRITCAIARRSCIGCWPTRARSTCAAATTRPTSWSSTPTRSATAWRALLAEVQRIKSEGDYAAAKELFETYGVHFDPEMRDEVVARVDHLNLPSYTGFVMPKLEPVTDGDGDRSSTSRSRILAT